jgi:hypothetical protein
MFASRGICGGLTLIGKGDGEGASLARDRFDADLTTVCLDQLPGDVEPKAESGCDSRFIRAVKAFEQSRHGVGRNANAFIHNPNPNVTVDPFDADGDHTTLRAVLDGVTEQIIQNLREPVSIPAAS